jgi:predicted PurR-regulated permease PerM
MPYVSESHARVARWFFLLLAAAAALLFWRVVHPYAITLVTAAIAAVVLAPLEKRVRGAVRHPRISTVIMLLLTLFLVVGPLGTVAVLMLDQAVEIGRSTVANPDWVAGFKLDEQGTFERLPSFVREGVLSLDVVGVLRNAAQWAASNLGAIVSGTATLALNAFIFFVALYYFLLDRERIAKEIMLLSPLRDSVDREIAMRLMETVRGVILGSLIVAVVQGVLAGIGLTIFGVPGALLWAALVVVAAQIPMLGTSIVMLPCVAYLFVSGHPTAATGLLVWSLVLVSTVDNMLKPIVVGGRTRMHGLLILVSMLGGLEAFGPIGFILGPTILAGILVVAELYKAGILENNRMA